MRDRNVKNSVLAIAAAVPLLMTGCQSDAVSNAETEALKEQIARLEQQVADLERQQPAAGSGQQTQDDTSAGDDRQAQDDTSAGDDRQAQDDTSIGSSQKSEGNAGNNTQIQPDRNSGNIHSPRHDEGDYHDQSNYAGNGSASDQQGTAADGLTTYTMEELGAMVGAFAAKAGAAAPSGQDAQDMEQFFVLKQEEKQIDDTLDSHEDELEYLYKTGSLTRDDYKRLERELELLEDRLDAAEDQLEYVFGIDD